MADDGAALNVITRGFVTGTTQFAEQRKAYVACCRQESGHEQCEVCSTSKRNEGVSKFENFAFFSLQEFRRRRPYTFNFAVRTPAGFRGDLQVTSFDGADIVFNGEMEMLMAKGDSTEAGVGFAMTALLQVRLCLRCIHPGPGRADRIPPLI